MDAGWQIAFDKGLGGEVVFQGVTKCSVLEAGWGGGGMQVQEGKTNCIVNEF